MHLVQIHRLHMKSNLKKKKSECEIIGKDRFFRMLEKDD